ncbi:YcxB family protein [Actinokineospora cianjurensis]|uniref:YcxB-like protein n=1 Tax=Actinokineospora cianjurensis TaxID=585224 RepID=A0A421B555_9PSEU|nr:YcxB family protein [Actinokineospora cianjurensis]RLK59378.1 YcxB-like protein [Actinokineospora cianjurensis]
MRLRWTPVPADWADGVRAVVPFTRWVPWFALALGAFSAVLLVLGQNLPGVFGLVCAVVIAAMPFIAVRHAFRGNPVAGRTVTADIDDHSVRMMTADGSAYSDLVLTDLTGWVETDRSFLLRTGPSGFHPVPGRAFDTTEDIDRFRDLLTRALGPAGVPPSAP